MIINNLFIIFDSTTILNLSSNWISILFIMLMFPKIFFRKKISDYLVPRSGTAIVFRIAVDAMWIYWLDAHKAADWVQLSEGYRLFPVIWRLNLGRKAFQLRHGYLMKSVNNSAFEIAVPRPSVIRWRSSFWAISEDVTESRRLRSLDFQGKTWESLQRWPRKSSIFPRVLFLSSTVGVFDPSCGSRPLFCLFPDRYLPRTAGQLDSAAEEKDVTKCHLLQGATEIDKCEWINVVSMGQIYHPWEGSAAPDEERGREDRRELDGHGKRVRERKCVYVRWGIEPTAPLVIGTAVKFDTEIAFDIHFPNPLARPFEDNLWRDNEWREKCAKFNLMASASSSFSKKPSAHDVFSQDCWVVSAGCERS